MELIFATNNLHKLREIQDAASILPFSLPIQSLSDLGCREEIPETADTLEGNAWQKASFVFGRYGTSCFADDTALEVDALGGAPGVYSARYAGEGCSFDDNINKLLLALEGNDLRTARFRTVICLILNGTPHYFEGSVAGIILKERKGAEGFGYDPIFQPDGTTLSFAQMDLADKNQISHRGMAIRNMMSFLSENKSIT